jgi:hypothetical protein
VPPIPAVTGFLDVLKPEEMLDTGKAAWDKATENNQLPVMVTKEFSLASCSVPENRTILCVGTRCRSPLAMTALFGFAPLRSPRASAAITRIPQRDGGNLNYKVK